MASQTGQDTHEVRKLKHQLKLQNKTVGKQGDTIHKLRAELAETRELHSKIERGELRRLERSVEHLLRLQAHDESIIASLRSQVASYKTIESALRGQLVIAKGETPVVEAPDQEEALTPH